MGVTQTWLSLDSYYRRTTGDKIIINDLSFFSVDDLENVNKNLMTVYDSDVLSTIPSCDCGYYNERYLVGEICPNCSTTCREVHEKVDPLLWLKTIHPNIKFLNPDFWLVLKKILHKNLDFVRWMCDAKYNPPIDLPNYMLGVKALLKERTYTNFLKQLPEVLEYLKTHVYFKDPEKNKKLDIILHMYKNEKDVLFSTYLPIINKRLFVMENTTKGKFTNLAVAGVIDVVMTWIKIISDGNMTKEKIAYNTGIVIHKLAELYYNYFDKHAVRKIGIFRKHVFGGRSHFTFRSVITALAGPHKQDEIAVPWAIGVTAFRPHLINKLCETRGIPYIEASNLLYRAVKSYIPIIDELLKELIDDSPFDGGIPVLSLRNPALLQGSALRQYISVFKTDVEDLTVSVSSLSLKSQNGDFDGDKYLSILS